MKQPNKILLVEDDFELSKMVVEFLEPYGFKVSTESNGLVAASRILAEDPRAVILDVNLPGKDGFDVCRDVRGKYRGAIIFLTARGDEIDEVVALEIGADDYLTKPFQMEELLARLKALLRRATGTPSTSLKCGPIEIDVSTQVVTVDDNNVDLTSFEYRLLEHLIRHQGEVLSKQILTDYLYPHDEDRDSNVLEVMVGRLRRKLDPSGSLSPIETLRGRGYRFTIACDKP